MYYLTSTPSIRQTKDGVSPFQKRGTLREDIVISVYDTGGRVMVCYILTRTVSGKVRVVKIKKPISNCPNFGFGPYDFLPTQAYIYGMEASGEKLPSWETLQEFDYETILELLDKIVTLRKKEGYARKPTLH